MSFPLKESILPGTTNGFGAILRQWSIFKRAPWFSVLFEKSMHEVAFRAVVGEWFCIVTDKVKAKTEGLMPAV